MCWRNKWRKKNKNLEIIVQPENPVIEQKQKEDELPIPLKVPSVQVMPSKKDADELSPKKVAEIENKKSSKSIKKSKSVISELNTLKDIPLSMPIIDVQHDDMKKDKFYSSAELL